MKRINVYSVQLVREKSKMIESDNKRIKSPEDAYLLLDAIFDLSNKTKEHFVMLALSTKNDIVGAHTIHIGSLNSSIVHPREVFQLAILNNAAAIIVCHNHPSGEVTPSSEDIIVTERLQEAGKIIGIDVLDHVIIGHHNFISLKERGYL